MTGVILVAVGLLAATWQAADLTDEQLGPVRTGSATHYGVSYQGQRMGCGGVYRTGDVSIIAVPPSRYQEWPCGTPLLVSGPAGQIIGIRQDSCPGCDRAGVIVDLSEAGHAAVCGVGTCRVTVQRVYPALEPEPAPDEP